MVDNVTTFTIWLAHTCRSDTFILYNCTYLLGSFLIVRLQDYHFYGENTHLEFSFSDSQRRYSILSSWD